MTPGRFVLTRSPFDDMKMRMRDYCGVNMSLVCKKRILNMDCTEVRSSSEGGSGGCLLLPVAQPVAATSVSTPMMSIRQYRDMTVTA